MVMPYLHFNGNCEEAFNFYAEAFGGKIDGGFSRLNNDPNNEVMHAQVMLTETGGVAGSDRTKEEGPFPILPVEILVHLPSREKVESVLKRLSEGGTDISEFAPHPPPDDAGGCAAVTDKYGYTWILSAGVN